MRRGPQARYLTGIHRVTLCSFTKYVARKKPGCGNPAFVAKRLSTEKLTEKLGEVAPEGHGVVCILATMFFFFFSHFLLLTARWCLDSSGF
jgi:hypothetical protein